MTVQPSQSSIDRGQSATYAVTISTENGSASDVTVALTAQPSTQKATFTTGCAKGDTTATCTISSVSDTKAVDLKAQIPVASGATSVSSVKLTATASVVTTAKWTAPSVTEAVSVTAVSASASPSASSTGSATGTVLPLGPLPSLNGVSSSLVGASNASGLFPAISPSSAGSSPSPSAGGQSQNQNQSQGGRRVSAASMADSSPLAPVLTAQIAGLIALGVALLLTMTRMGVRKRVGVKKAT